MVQSCLMAAFLAAAPLLAGFQGDTRTEGSKLSPQEATEGFVSLFDGASLEGWQGSLEGYVVENGVVACKEHGGGNLLTKKEFADFVLRFEYKLPPGGNNGVAIRTPPKGNPAYLGMEIQILDDSSPQYAKLHPEQYNGSIYGAVPAKRGHLKPVGEWNAMEIKAKGTQITVTLNGTVIVDADTSTVGSKEIHGGKLQGLQNPKGHVGFLGHGHRVEFRNIRIKGL